MYWPGRELVELTKDEWIHTEQEQLDEGLLQWCPFNSLLNSLPRTKLAAAFVAMTPAKPIHIGIDNTAVVSNMAVASKAADSLNRNLRNLRQLMTLMMIFRFRKYLSC